MRQNKTMMHKVMLIAVVATFALSAQGPRPTCHNCEAAYIPVSEFEAYTARAIKYRVGADQVRTVDAGKVQVGIGIVTRGKAVGEAGTDHVIEHEQVTEVYHIISGTATLLTSPELVNPVKKSADGPDVRQQSGPGYNSDTMKNPQANHLKPGDVIIIPAGTGHQFIEIPDSITYVVVRIDPDKVVALKSQEQSEASLKVAPQGRKHQ